MNCNCNTARHKTANKEIRTDNSFAYDMTKPVNACKGRIGIFGGTFDPFHYGHLSLIKKAHDAFELDKILIMPTDDPYYKSKRNVSPFSDRLNMAELAVRHEPYAEVSDFERAYDTDGYTYNMLSIFKKQNPDAEVFFIIGGDSLFTLENWMRIEDVFKMAVFLVSKREGESKGASGDLPVSKTHTDLPDDVSGNPSTGICPLNIKLNNKIAFLKEKYNAEIYNLYNESIDISSTDIRNKIRLGEDISSYVPSETAEYIYKHKLYTE